MYKKFAGLLLALVLANPVALACAADLDTVPQNEPVVSSSDSDITPYADVIVTKYRMYYGVPQYRRWNETRGYWVDPDWINMP